MKKTYAKMSQEDFDSILDEVAEKKGVASILAIDGVRELVQEELNNEVLEQWESNNPEAAQDWSEEETKIGRMTRDEIAGVLEANGIQCYDNEDKECLYTALLENVKDGTITLTED